MKTLIIYAHPYEKSYNASLLKQIQKKLKDTNQSHDVLDLYKEQFNPVISLEELALYSQGKGLDPKVDEYQKKISQAEHLIFVFPVWWYDLPAILKGFLDKVLLKDWAYEMSSIGIPKGKLTHVKKTTVISTMKSPKWYYWLVFRNSLKQSFIKGTLKFCGMKNVKWMNICNIENMGEKKREKYLENIYQMI